MVYPTGISVLGWDVEWHRIRQLVCNAYMHCKAASVSNCAYFIPSEAAAAVKIPFTAFALS